jgi:hypothetical protein
MLLFDNGGAQLIRFDANGIAVGFQPPERAPSLSGKGSISGDTMTISASGFVTNAGGAFTFTYTGARLTEAEAAGYIPPGLVAAYPGYGKVAFRGALQRSDLTTPNAVVALWVCTNCPIVFHPIP